MSEIASDLHGRPYQGREGYIASLKLHVHVQHNGTKDQ